jgi:hypothetical protein
MAEQLSAVVAPCGIADLRVIADFAHASPPGNRFRGTRS